MGLGGREGIIWNIYGKNWREKGKRVNGVTVFQFLKYKLRRSAGKMNFTMSQHRDTGENRAVHPPRHHLRAGTVLSSACFPAGHMLMGLCISSLDTKASIWHSWARNLFNVAARFVHAEGLCHTSPLSDSVFSTSLSSKKKKKIEKPKVEPWWIFCSGSLSSELEPQVLPLPFQWLLWGKMQWSVDVVWLPLSSLFPIIL